MNRAIALVNMLDSISASTLQALTLVPSDHDMSIEPGMKALSKDSCRLMFCECVCVYVYVCMSYAHEHRAWNEGFVVKEYMQAYVL